MEEALISRTVRWVVALLLVLLPANSLLYASQVSKEQHLKAAFLVQFVKFTAWPVSTSKDITIGVLGSASFTEAVSKYEGKRLHGKTLNVRKIDNIQEAETCCQLIFLTASESRRSRGILKHLVDRPILTVSETSGFTNNGGIIRIIKKGPKFTFVVNVKNAKQSGLEISSRMLRVAYAVED